MKAVASAAMRPSLSARRFLALTLLALLLAGAAGESAFARGRGGHSGGRHHGGHRAAVGVIFAAPLFWHFREPIYVPPVVVAPLEPQVYIEQGDAQAGPGQTAGDWWYYCAESKTYYPYVTECAGAWQRVPAELTR
jgi:hypothetical protein